MNHEIREILAAMGTGGTTEMAERVQTWAAGRRSTIYQPGIPPANILGLTAVSKLTGIPEGTIKAWATFGGFSFPKPVVDLAETSIWDRDQVQVWMRGHPDQLSPGSTIGNDTREDADGKTDTR